MKSCCKCGKPLVSGHIMCGNCKIEAELPLRYYIDQLAEEIVLEHAGACDLCSYGPCDSQQSGLTCRYGVKEYLLALIPKYEQKLSENMSDTLPEAC